MSRIGLVMDKSAQVAEQMQIFIKSVMLLQTYHSHQYSMLGTGETYQVGI